MNTKLLDQELVNLYIEEMREGAFKPRRGRPRREVWAAVAALKGDDKICAQVTASLARSESWTVERRASQVRSTRAKLAAVGAAIKTQEQRLAAARASGALPYTAEQARVIFEIRRELSLLGTQERRAAAWLKKYDIGL